MLTWIKRLRYLFGSQCEDELESGDKERCIRRSGHKGWHTANGNLYWGDKQ